MKGFLIGVTIGALFGSLFYAGILRADAARKPFHDSNKVEQTVACKAVVHRGMHGPGLDEETVPSVRGSAVFGFGAEIDARVALDGLVAVHDDRLSRITADADDRQPETLTMTQLRAVELEHGGQPASVRRLVLAARQSDGNLLIEGKRFPQHEAAWRGYGLDLLADAIRDLDMQRRAYVGGTLGFTRAFHNVAPHLWTFWRADLDDPLTVAEAGGWWARLTEADAVRWTPAKVRNFRHAGIIPATRNADTPARWRPAFNAGVRTFQTNTPRALTDWCRRQ